MELFRRRIPPLGELSSAARLAAVHAARPRWAHAGGALSQGARGGRRADLRRDRASAARPREAEERDDVLSLLLAARHEDGSPMSDVELRDELVTLLTAGHETTATGLSWAFERLLRTPRGDGAAARLAGRRRATSTPWSRRRCACGPWWSTWRARLTREIELGGWRLPAGTLVLPAIAAIHVRPDLYPEPHEFRPERFLGRRRPVVCLDSLRRRGAALHRRVVRAGRDEGRAARGAAAGATARGLASARAREGPPRDRRPRRAGVAWWSRSG